MGRLAAEKRVDLVVRAVADAAAAHPTLHLLVVGDGPAADALRGEAISSLGRRAAFSGTLPHASALATVAACDLFVFASRTETQGLVLAEALACGVPVVARSGPGVGESLRDGIDGVIAPDVGEMTRAIVALLDPARRASMAAAARGGAGRFDLARRLGEVQALYREVVGEI
jgi:glycosyltransferase involved in cell wall biosynthesis